MPALPARGCGGDDAANGPDAGTKGDKKENKRRKKSYRRDDEVSADSSPFLPDPENSKKEREAVAH